MYFHYYLPLEKGVALHLNKRDFPSPMDALCQVWLKLAPWFLRRRLLKLVNVFSLFPYYLSLEKGGVLHWTNLNPHHLRMLCAKFDLNCPSGSWEEVENRKSLQTDGQTDDVRQAIRKAHLSFQLRWAKNGCKAKLKQTDGKASKVNTASN